MDPFSDTNNGRQGKNEAHIKNLKVLIFLLDQKLFIKLLYEVHLLIPMKQMVEYFQNCAILNGYNLEGNVTTGSIEN